MPLSCGWFTPLVAPESWFHSSIDPGAWFDRHLINTTRGQFRASATLEITTTATAGYSGTADEIVHVCGWFTPFIDNKAWFTGGDSSSWFDRHLLNGGVSGGTGLEYPLQGTAILALNTTGVITIAVALAGNANLVLTVSADTILLTALLQGASLLSLTTFTSGIDSAAALSSVAVISLNMHASIIGGRTFRPIQWHTSTPLSWERLQPPYVTTTPTANTRHNQKR